MAPRKSPVKPQEKVIKQSVGPCLLGGGDLSAPRLGHCRADPETSLPALYLDSSLTACSGVESTAAPQKLLILDARSYTAAVANRAKGGGCECEGIVITQCHSHSGVGGLGQPECLKEPNKPAWIQGSAT